MLLSKVFASFKTNTFNWRKPACLNKHPGDHFIDVSASVVETSLQLVHSLCKASLAMKLRSAYAIKSFKHDLPLSIFKYVKKQPGLSLHLNQLVVQALLSQKHRDNAFFQKHVPALPTDRYWTLFLCWKTKCTLCQNAEVCAVKKSLSFV